MRTELFFPRATSEDRRVAVRNAFRESGLEIAREGNAALKSVEIGDLRIDVAFLVAATVGGVAWDLEKELLRRGLAALRSKWVVGGSVAIDTTDQL